MVQLRTPDHERRQCLELQIRGPWSHSLPEVSCQSIVVPYNVNYMKTRLHQFARSLLYNATAGGALW